MAGRVGALVQRTVAEAKHHIFGAFSRTHFGNNGGPNGRKNLIKTLIGRKIAEHYEPFSMSTFRNPQRHVLWHMMAVGNERGLMTEVNDNVKQDLADRKRGNKLPPKKGQGKRAGRKKK